MSWDLCRKCGRYEPSASHHCPPAWKLWRPEHGGTEEDAITVYGYSAEAAVEAWAERDDRDSADYSIVGGNNATVHVRFVGDQDRARALCFPTEEMVLEVVGESVPSYTARCQNPKRRDAGKSK